MIHVIRLVGFLWLWFSVCLPLMEKDKRLMEGSWWDRRLRGKLGLVLRGGAMPSESNPIFCWGLELCSLPADWDQSMVEWLPWWLRCRRCRFNPRVGKISWKRKRQPTPVFLPGKSHGHRSLVGYSPWHRKESDRPEWLHFYFQAMVEVMKIMVTSFKRSHACTATLRAPNPVAGHHQPTPLLETPGHSRASLGQSLAGSLLLSPGSWCTRFCLCPPGVYFPVLCKFWQLYGGLMVTSSKSAYSIPESTAPRAPVPVTVRHWPEPPQEMLKHSSVSVSVRSLGPGIHKVCLSPLSISGRNGVWF